MPSKPMPSKSPVTSEPKQNPSADDLIRSVMAAQKREVNRQALPPLEPAEPEGRGDVYMTRQSPSARLMARLTRRRRPAKGHLARIRAYRPKRGHVVLAALALGLYLWPLLILGSLVLIILIGLIYYLSMGPDKIGEQMRGAWDWLQRNHPDRAERLRLRSDCFALKLDRILDRLPDHWADKLALPDFSQPSEQKRNLDDLPDPFERLKRLPEVYRG